MTRYLMGRSIEAVIRRVLYAPFVTTVRDMIVGPYPAFFFKSLRYFGLIQAKT